MWCQALDIYLYINITLSIHDILVQSEITPLFRGFFFDVEIVFSKLAGLWLVGEVVDAVRRYEKDIRRPRVVWHSYVGLVWCYCCALFIASGSNEYFIYLVLSSLEMQIASMSYILNLCYFFAPNHHELLPQFPKMCTEVDGYIHHGEGDCTLSSLTTARGIEWFCVIVARMPGMSM